MLVVKNETYGPCKHMDSVTKVRTHQKENGQNSEALYLQLYTIANIYCVRQLKTVRVDSFHFKSQRCRLRTGRSIAVNAKPDKNNGKMSTKKNGNTNHEADNVRQTHIHTVT